jgi:succinate dehydrogenase hydrophobic anchor subunit
MKRSLRFVKWFVSKCGWFEALLFTSSFTLVGGLTAGEGTTRNIFWGIAVCLNVLAALIFVAWGVRNMWRDFIKHDEQVFEILKKDDIK